MDLSLSELVRIRILPPADRSPAISPEKKIRSMVILEGGPSFFEHLPQHALVFFPHGASACVSPSQLLALGKAQCAAVLYASDPLLAFPGSQFPLPVFVIPDTCSISKVIEECYQYAFSGIQKLAELCGIPMESVAAIGDYYNDLEMLQTAGITAVPQNGPEEIQKLADVVTCHCNDGAVADFIEYLEQKDD